MKFISDITKKEWSVEKEDLESFRISLKIGFRDNGNLPVIFNKMSFGFYLTDENERIVDETFPPEGVEHISTDQEILDIFYIDYLYPDKEYILTIWSKNDNDSWQYSEKIILPRLEQPFPSWTYDEQEHSWEPPVAPPQDPGIAYEWDEDKKQWVKPLS